MNRRAVLQSVAGVSALALTPRIVLGQPNAALATAPRRALIVGNASYKDAPLRNPVNDAKALAEELKRARFDVDLLIDATRDQIVRAIDTHADALAQRKAMGVFYFAGHGAQLAWRNYLVPIDAVIHSVDDVPARTVELNGLLQALTRANNPMNVVILDACRDNPFGTRLPVEQKGLSQFDAPPGLLLAYATAPGNVADDGDGMNGLYTENLVRELKAPGAKIEDIFKRVRLTIRRRSNGRQIPWESTSLEEDFYFLPPKIVKTDAVEAEAQFEEELALWEQIKAARDPRPLEDFLRRYPSGKFSELAQFRLDRILADLGEKRVQIAPEARIPSAREPRVST